MGEQCGLLRGLGLVLVAVDITQCDQRGVPGQVSLPLNRKPPVSSWWPTLRTSAHSNHLPKAPPPGPSARHSRGYLKTGRRSEVTQDGYPSEHTVAITGGWPLYGVLYGCHRRLSGKALYMAHSLVPVALPLSARPRPQFNGQQLSSVQFIRRQAPCPGICSTPTVPFDQRHRGNSV